jgi:tetratricopeptide (TPR) repeat protein
MKSPVAMPPQSPQSPPGGGQRPARRRARWPTVLHLLAWAAALGLTAWHEGRPAALRESEAAYRRADFTTAVRRSLDHLGRRPWSRSAARLAALGLSRLDFADTAEPYYRRAGALSVDDRHIRAYGLVRSNQRQRAIDAYVEILARRPDDVLAMSRQAAVLLSQGRFDEAAALAERLIRTPGGGVIGYTLLGSAKHDLKEPEAAVAAFERVLELDPQLRSMPLPATAFWDYLAGDLLAAGRAASARDYLTRALAEHDDATLMDDLGRAYHQAGDADEARRWWGRALRRDPNCGTAWLDLGRWELGRGRPRAAVPLLARAAELVPESVEPAYSLSLAYRQLGQDQEARRWHDRTEQFRRRGRGRPPRSS